MQMSNMQIYLDNAASTKTDVRVIKEMESMLKIEGNPSSLNLPGLRAREIMNDARERIALVLNCKAQEIIFTSGGTESNNLAILGTAKMMRKMGKNHIITTQIEHASILSPCKYLEQEENFKVTYLKPDKLGQITAGQIQSAITKETGLITLSYANNEIGTIQPVAEIAHVAKAKKVLLHIDASQSYYLDLDVSNLADLVTINSSKLYGPKGIGLLFVKQGTPIRPIIYGGGQEKGLRSGTENVGAIVGFAKSLELQKIEHEQEAFRISKLRDKLISGLLKIPNAHLNGHPINRLPNNVNISFEDIDGESLIMELNDHGIFAATGAACSTISKKTSHVLLAITNKKLANSSLRLSMGKDATEEDVAQVLKTIPEVVQKLRSYKLAKSARVKEIPEIEIPKKEMEVLEMSIGD